MIILLLSIILLLVDHPLEIASFSPRILNSNNFLPSYTRLNAVVTKSQPVYLPDLSQPAFPVPPEEGYDLVVLGSGPGGESIATHAAKLGARVAVIEKKAAFGGPTGLSSKAVREATKRITSAIDQIGGDRRKQIRGLWKRKFPILKTAAEAWQAVESRERLRKCGCDLYIGSAELLPSFEKGVTKTIIRVCRPSGCIELESFHVCIATGSRAHQPNEVREGVPIEFIKGLIVDATEISSITNLPKAIVIIGGGVIAVEYATVYAELGVGVTLICPENALLPFIEKDLRQSLINRMKKNHILIVHDDIKEISVINATSTTNATPSVKVAMVPDPKRPNVQRIFTVDLLVYSGGRDANSESMGLENLNILTKKYGQIAVDENFRTVSENSVYAIGDVIGPPGLASSAQQQGRFVAETLFESLRDNITPGSFASSEWQENYATEKKNLLFGSVKGKTAIDAPMTLWTIPELASVGMTKDKAIATLEDGATESSVIEGIGYFNTCARGKLSGEEDGFLKVTAKYNKQKKAHEIVGVHIFGEGANELIQLGSVLVHSTGVTLEAVSNTPFSAVTLSGLYQAACEDALNRFALTKHT